MPSVLLTAVPATSYPTPGPLMSTPLINTGQPPLYNINPLCFVVVISKPILKRITNQVRVAVHTLYQSA